MLIFPWRKGRALTDDIARRVHREVARRFSVIGAIGESPSPLELSVHFPPETLFRLPRRDNSNVFSAAARSIHGSSVCAAKDTAVLDAWLKLKDDVIYTKEQLIAMGLDTQQVRLCFAW
jgi:hypothetical protein